MPVIAANAVVHPEAEIHDSVEIGEFCVVGPHVSLGEGTKLASHVVINGHTTIGAHNLFYPFSVLGTEPQSLKYDGEPTQLIIGDGNTIREHVMINTGTADFGGKTVVGNDNYLMAYTHVAHDCQVGNRCILANGATLAGHVEMGDFVNVGGLTPVHQFVKIGSYTMIGGASAVSQDIPPFCIAEGNRAKLRGLNRIGLRKHFSREQIDQLHSAYKNIFDGSAPYKEKAEQLAAETAEEAVKTFCRFIIESKRGIPTRKAVNEHEKL